MRRILTAFLLFIWAAAAYAEAPDDNNRIVAVVNDEVITQSELHRALVPAYLQLQTTLGPEELSKQMEGLKTKILQQIIEEKLMLQEARDPKPVEVAKGRIGTPYVIEVTPEEIDEMMAETRARFEKPEEFEEALAAQNLTLEDLEERFKDQITIQKLIVREVRSKVQVSPAEVTAYYEKNKEKFKTPVAVQVATLLIQPKNNADTGRASAKAQELYRQLGQGADFYELAKRNSDGFNAQMGGRIGFLEKGKGRKEIEEVLFGLKPGQISPVIKTPAGYQVFKVESIRPERQAELKEVQGDIQYQLYLEKGALRYKDWMTRLRDGSYITIK